MSAQASTPAVLVVDDNADAADSLALILGLEGYRTVAAYDGRSALASIERDSPAAVLLDIGLPDIDGLEVARQTRERFPERRILIFALTGHGSREDRDAAETAGCDGHLVKPVDPGVVLELLQSRL